MGLQDIFKFGEAIPYEKEIGAVLIVLGVGLILWFQMEPSIPAKAAASKVGNTTYA